MNPNINQINQPNFQIFQRERPMQKSMILPDHYSSQTTFNHYQHTSSQFSSSHAMKKSAINFQQPYNQQKQEFFQLQNSNINQKNAMQGSNAQTSSYNFRNKTFFSELQPSKNIQNSNTQEQKPLTLQFSPQKQIKSLFQLSGNENINNEKIIKEVINIITTQHLPNILKSIHNQFYNDLHNLRVDLQSMKSQISEEIDRKVAEKIEKTKSFPNIDQNSNKNKKKNEISELQKQFFLLEGKMKTIQQKMDENFKKHDKEIQNILKNEKSSLKSATVKSTLPPIMIEYRETFKIVQNQNEKNPSKDEIFIDSSLYYIDSNGFLLDSDNRYIVDKKGIQIRLDEKHFKILQSHKILYR